MCFLRWLTIISALALFSCRKPLGTSWDVQVALPVANTRLNISNLVSDSLLRADSTGHLHFHVQREVASLLLDSLIDLPDTVFLKRLENDKFPVSLNPGDKINIFPPSEMTFDIGGGVELIVADLRSGFMKVQFSNELAEPIDLTYRIPSATRNGLAFEINETVPPGNHSLERTYDLSGYSLNLRGEKGNRYNTIVQTYTVGLNSGADPLTVNIGEGAILEVSYSNIVPQYVQGYFGQETIEIASDTSDFSFLKNVKADNFMLEDVTMRFDVLNEFGADFLASLANVTSINSEKNNAVQLNHSKLARIPINWPNKSGGAVKASTTTIEFDRNNSNIVPFISNLPDKIVYKGSVEINPPPAGDVIGHTNYANHGSGIRILADIDIPLRFSARRLRLESRIETDFRDVRQLDNVRDGFFILDVTNGFPFDTRLQVYMQDEWGMVLDSLFEGYGNLIMHAKLDGQNQVLAPGQSLLHIPITQEKANHLRQCRRLLIKPTVNLPPGSISIYETYDLHVKIRAEIGYNVGVRSR